MQSGDIIGFTEWCHTWRNVDGGHCSLYSTRHGSVCFLGVRITVIARHIEVTNQSESQLQTRARKRHTNFQLQFQCFLTLWLCLIVCLLQDSPETYKIRSCSSSRSDVTVLVMFPALYLCFSCVNPVDFIYLQSISHLQIKSNESWWLMLTCAT